MPPQASSKWWQSLGLPAVERGFVVGSGLHTLGNRFAHLAIQPLLGAAVEHRCLIDVLTLHTRLLDVVEHHPIPDQMAVVRHQHPLVQQRKRSPPKQHGVGVDEPLRVGERAGAHHRAIQAAEGAAARDEIRLLLIHHLQQMGDVIRAVPVVGIEESHRLHPQANGVVTTDQPRCYVSHGG